MLHHISHLLRLPECPLVDAYLYYTILLAVLDKITVVRTASTCIRPQYILRFVCLPHSSRPAVSVEKYEFWPKNSVYVLLSLECSVLFDSMLPLPRKYFMQESTSIEARDKSGGKVPFECEAQL